MSATSFWNERYQSKDYIFGTEPNQFIRAVTQPASEGQTAFAPADGEGRNGVYLAKLGYHVTSADVSNLGVDKALALANEHQVNINAHVGDLLTMDVPLNHYDLVIICFMHFMPQDHQTFMEKMKLALKPGGILVMEAYTINQTPLSSGGPKSPDMMMSRKQLAAEFADFDILLLQETHRHLDEGPRHHGDAATVQLLAQKKNSS